MHEHGDALVADLERCMRQHAGSSSVLIGSCRLVRAGRARDGYRVSCVTIFAGGRLGFAVTLIGVWCGEGRPA